MAATSTEKTSSANAEADLAAEVAQIRQDIAALAKTLGAVGKARLDALPDAASRTAEETLESARQGLKDIRREVSALEQRAERSVVDHPMQSLLVAVGFGFLIAFLVRR